MIRVILLMAPIWGPPAIAAMCYAWLYWRESRRARG